MVNADNKKDQRRLNDIFHHKSPELPKDVLESFVKKYFERGGYFTSILNHLKPPMYVLDTMVLKQKATRFRDVFNKYFNPAGYYFAMKSNNHPMVAGILAKEGFGLDVSSGLELQVAIETGVQDIVFSGPGKTDEELVLATDYCDRVIILVDSFGELVRLENVTKNRHTRVSIGVRLTTQPLGLWRKFGILPEELRNFWEIVQNSDHIQFKGLQFHTSWNLSPAAQVDFIKYLSEILTHMPSNFKRQLAFIDIGGGYWPEEGEWLRHEGTLEGAAEKIIEKVPANPLKHYRLSSVPVENFAQKLSEAVHYYFSELFPLKIFFEPGRWLVTDAMHLMLTVVDKKGKDLVITDAGTNAIGWERYETDYCPIVNLTRPMMKEHKCLVVGSLCTPHDVWGGAYWGEGIEIGDILMIPAQGAYTYSLRQNFIKAVPDVIIV